MKIINFKRCVKAKSERELLKSIYKVVMWLTLLGPAFALTPLKPIAMPVMLTLAIVSNLVIWAKYYKKESNTSFQKDIKKLLKYFVVAMIVLGIGYLPSLYPLNGIPEDEARFLILTAGMDTLGIVCSWLYYLLIVFKDYTTRYGETTN
jgi:hypothetical protein